MYVVVGVMLAACWYVPAFSPQPHTVVAVAAVDALGWECACLAVQRAVVVRGVCGHLMSRCTYFAGHVENGAEEDQEQEGSGWPYSKEGRGQILPRQGTEQTSYVQPGVKENAIGGVAGSG